MNRTKDKGELIEWMVYEIDQAASKKVPLQIEGTYYRSSGDWHPPLLKEKETYMEDYVGDDAGKIVEIIFNKVKYD